MRGKRLTDIEFIKFINNEIDQALTLPNNLNDIIKPFIKENFFNFI